MNFTWPFWISVSRWADGDSFHSILSGVAEFLRDISGHVDVESAHGAVGVLQSEAGLIELGADDDLVGRTAATTAASGR
jgi:hypothetical protein